MKFAATACLIGALVLGGCQGLPSATHAGRGQGAKPPSAGGLKVATSGGATVVAGADAADATPIGPDTSAGVIANHGGGLMPLPPGTVQSDHGFGPSPHGGAIIGRVVAPVGLVSNNGSGVIANNGGGIVSNNGGAYRLLAVDETRLSGVSVVLVQADGQPVLDEAKQPISATTDGEGRYRLPVGANPGNLIVRVVLADAKGNLIALVPRGQSEGERTVDINLVSTLVMGYILDRYVDTQVNRQATLDKLPAGVEAETRARAQQALESGSVAVPSTLESAQVIKTVDAMRARDVAFNGQLEVVKKLLVAAGQSDLGNGRFATQVALSGVDDIVSMPNGETFFTSRIDNRVWRLATDGRLYTAVGRSRVTVDEKLDGKAGADVAIARPVTIIGDGDGVVLLETTRLSRRGADGLMKELATNLVNAKAVWPMERGFTVLEGPTFKSVFSTGPSAPLVLPARLVAVTPGQSPTAIHTFTDSESRTLKGVRRAARTASANIALALSETVSVPTTVKTATGTKQSMKSITKYRIYTMDPPGYALTQVAERDLNLDQALTIDDRGALARQPKGTLTLQVGANGETSPRLPSGIRQMSNLQAVAHEGPAGLLIGWGDKLFRLSPTGQKAEAIAGVLIPPRSGRADEIVLQSPTLLAVDRQGKLYIYDDQTSWLWEIATDGQARVIFSATEAAAESTENLIQPTVMRVDAAGRLVILDQSGAKGYQRLVTIDGTGRLSEVFAADAAVEEEISDFFPLVGGGFKVLVNRTTEESEGQFLLEIGSDGSRKTMHALGTEGDLGHVAVTAGGKVFLMASDRLLEWTPTGTKAIATPENWFDVYSSSDGWLAMDAQGRLISNDDDRSVRRLDPATGTSMNLVGVDANSFSGTSVDESTGYWLKTPCLDGAGNLYFIDPENRQVKRIPATDIQ